MKKFSLKKSSLHLALAVLLGFSLAYSLSWQAVMYRSLVVPIDGYYFEVASGSSFNKITQQLNQAGVLKYPGITSWYARFKGVANNIKAGEYKIIPGTSINQLVSMLADGQVTQYAITIVEGWRIEELLAEINRHPKLKHNLSGLSNQQIIAKLDLPIKHLEGMFLPDTYYFHAGASDIDFLRRAYFNLQEKLHVAWESRSKSTVLKTPYEALIMASIIEKESGCFDEYREISGVYQRRLAKKMKLQADPTVVYFLADKLQGQSLRHKHLKIDSPYNTYMRYGLPPTPIAMPSIKAINAAVDPASGDTLYFVAKGDGSHVFTRTFAEHTKKIGQIRSRLK